MHTHEWAHVGVIIPRRQLVFDVRDGKPEDDVNFEAGSVGFREAKVTHVARNPGKAPMTRHRGRGQVVRVRCR